MTEENYIGLVKKKQFSNFYNKLKYLLNTLKIMATSQTT